VPGGQGHWQQALHKIASSRLLGQGRLPTTMSDTAFFHLLKPTRAHQLRFARKHFFTYLFAGGPISERWFEIRFACCGCVFSLFSRVFTRKNANE